jgi:hypothetical protein
MGRVTSNRKLAEALLKTLRQLEADPTVDSDDPAFIHLKANILQRLLSLEVDTAEIQASIHLVESPEAEAAADTEEDAAIA